jgi:protein disulfide-isomerase
MKYLLGCVVSVLMLGTAFFVMGAMDNTPSTLAWYTDYSKALDASKKSNKPIVLFFTGSDWCTWCNKMEAEILSQPDFVSAVGNKYIFVKLDFPMKTKLDPRIEAQNNALMDKYKVDGFPVLIVIDNQEKYITKANYQQGGAKNFATLLQKLVADRSTQLTSPR